jgi:uncharacterized protein (TIGR00255 family)
MIHSMTGYHKLSFDYTGKTIHIEVKSLNSKSLDINTRIPSVYKEYELSVRELIHKYLVRGKVEFAIYVDLTDASYAATINQSLFINYYHQIKQISSETGIPIDNDIFSVITRFPDILQSDRQTIDEDEWKAISIKIEECLEMVSQFRKDEGISLETDIKQATEHILKLTDEVEKYEESRIKDVRSRMENNLKKLTESPDFEQNRFEQELIYYIEKLDINEEKVRLRNHCKYFLETIDSNQSAGKKLGFISQEMGREINTLGSKANHMEIQKIVVEMKESLEKIKEQVLNIL